MVHAFLPSVIKRKYLARNVRSALMWRADLSRPGQRGLVRFFTEAYHGEMRDFGPTIGQRLPFGWVARRAASVGDTGIDVIVVGPFWFFLLPARMRL